MHFYSNQLSRNVKISPIACQAKWFTRDRNVFSLKVTRSGDEYRRQQSSNYWSSEQTTKFPTTIDALPVRVIRSDTSLVIKFSITARNRVKCSLVLDNAVYEIHGMISIKYCSHGSGYWTSSTFFNFRFLRRTIGEFSFYASDGCEFFFWLALFVSLDSWIPSKLNWTFAMCIGRVCFPMDFEDSALNWIFVKLHNLNCECGWTRFALTVATIRIERQFKQPDQRWDYSLRHNLSVVSEGNQVDKRW